MLDAVNLRLDHGGAGERGKQYPAQGITQGMAEAAVKGFQRDLGYGRADLFDIDNRRF
jgi:hypothetical protein